jgi:hypothetical protein
MWVMSAASITSGGEMSAVFDHVGVTNVGTVCGVHYVGVTNVGCRSSGHPRTSANVCCRYGSLDED